MTINRDALDAYRAANLLLDDQLDDQTRRLVAAWVQAWDTVAAELDAAAAILAAEARGGRITARQVLRTERAMRALRTVQEAIDRLAGAAGVTIAGSLSAVVDQAIAAQQAIIGAQLPPALRPYTVRVDARQVDAAVRRTSQRITAATRRLSAEGQAAIRRELVRGIAVGANPRRTARRMVAGIEDRFNGGLSRALVISRTETMDAYRNAALAQRKASADVVQGWTWLAELSARTCPACLGMHGTEHAADEPGPNGHHQCRCVAVPTTRSWADLGFPELQEPRDVTPDAGRWFNQQPAATQQRILGAKGYQAWTAGDWPRERWATLRHTSGWRDSYVPARPPSTASAAA
jgi:SPP1 gp7 family putative phage head morphogenesis protein